MINLIIVPVVIALIAMVTTMLVGGFRSFMNLTFLVPVLVTFPVIMAFGHPYDLIAGAARFDYDRIWVGIIAGIAGMLIGCLWLLGRNLVRNNEPIHLSRPGYMNGCRVRTGR